MLYDSDNEWANANATTWTNHTNNGEWGKQGPEGRRLYRRGYTEWSRSGQYMWGKEMRGGTGRSTGGCEVLLMFQKLMSSQVFITLNIWMRGPCQTQWWQYVMNHGYNQSLLSTWVPAPPPIKQWGDVMNRQFTEQQPERTTSTSNQRNVALEIEIIKYHFIPNQWAKIQNFIIPV